MATVQSIMRICGLAALLAGVPLKVAGAAPPESAASETVTAYSITMIDIRPDQSEKGATLLGRYAATLQSVPGCTRVDLIRQPAPNANHFALVTVWLSDADRGRHVSGEAAKRFRTALQPLTASPVDDRIYRTME